MKSPIEIRELEDCGVCGNQRDFSSIYKLPNLPLTEVFGEFEIDFPNFDQDLIMCNLCGHTQLKNQINSDFLYSPENYAFRAGNSKKSNDELDFLKEFVNNVLKEINVNHVLEIGANDLKFSKLLKKHIVRLQLATHCYKRSMENVLMVYKLLDFLLKKL